MIVGEPIDFIEEELECAPVAKLEEGIAEDALEEVGEMAILRLRQLLDAVDESCDALLGAELVRHEFAPGVVAQLPDKEGRLAFEFACLLVHVVHELVNERDGDEFDLVAWQRELPHEYLPRAIDAVFGILGEHE